MRAAQVLQRVNVFNGRTYRTDPAILGWDILSEPRDDPALQNPQPPGRAHFDLVTAMIMWAAMTEHEPAIS